MAWDLTEPDSLHHVKVLWKDDTDLVLRTPTYNTSFMKGISKNATGSHVQGLESPVRAIQTLIDPNSR